ncbi:MAG TPA: ClC family H(+)/Cl(-) exchange transporter [Stellaceae bacterium]|nr:ClC family H(+)/Cl(-) exchange transporter [Stellaceae bacterium]
MRWRRERRVAPTAGEGSLLALALLALVAGAGSGLVVAVFRLALAAADRWRNALLAGARQLAVPFAGFLLVVIGSAVAVGLAAWLVRRFSPYASGSGIPQVEAALTGDLPPAPPRLITVKFVGGLLAIGAGMALGREGPSVQMGAVVADLVGKWCRRSWPDLRTLLASGAGAGLAVAFNAPIAGAVFVLEELVRRLETRIAIAALGASSTAILISRLFLGDMPDFQVTVSAQATTATGPLPYGLAATWPLYVALGIVAGAAAGLYNRTILGATALAARLDRRCPVEIQAATIGALVGIVGWFAPGLIGGGGEITQRVLAGGAAIATIPLAFAVRFGLGAASYAARTPGGLFAPLLVLGAQLGLVCGALARAAFPGLGIEPEAFAVVGMAAFFTGVVQAPVTGIVLVTEMTAAFTTLLPMLAACFAAIVTANLLCTLPIYDALRERVARQSR